MKYYFLILQSYLTDRFFQVSQGTSLFQYYPVKAEVPQDSILHPLLYTAYTIDIPTHPETSIFTFADDTAIFSSNKDPVISHHALQAHLKNLEPSLKKMAHKVNINKN